jgi:hypothetical protein
MVARRTTRSSKTVAPPSPPSSSSSSSSSSEEEDDPDDRGLPLSTEKQLLQDIEQNGGREKAKHNFTRNIINIRPIIYGDRGSKLRKAIWNKFSYLGRLEHRAYLVHLSDFQVSPSTLSLQAATLHEQPALQAATPPSATLKPLLSPSSKQQPLKRKQSPLLTPPRSQPAMFSPTKKSTPSKTTPSKANRLLMTKSTPSRVLFGE